MTQFKICGLCRSDDAAAAISAGASYAGVILSPGYRRSQTVASAASIFSAATGARRVGVFVDAELRTMIDAARALDLDVIQLHGDESPDLARAIMPHAQVWKAVRVRDRAVLQRAVADYAGSVAGLLLDGYRDDAAGGTGTAFDWDDAANDRRRIPSGVLVVVAGGLTPENVGVAIDALRPDVVDVSSGVEHNPGEKSASLLKAFARAVDAARSLPAR